MPLSRTVASLTSHARQKAINLQPVLLNRASRVATETSFRCFWREWSSQRIFKRRGYRMRMENREVEPLEFLIIAYAAFVKRAAVLQDVGLADFTLTKAKQYR